MGERPIIGITSYSVRARWGVWDTEAALVPMVYVRAIEHAGGRAVGIPPAEKGIDETIEALDGLLLSGGEDIDPEQYGATPHLETKATRPDRDRAELALLRAALDSDLPVLAVCRGSQVLNVAHGGDLVQHLPEVVGSDRHKHTPGIFADHDVELSPDSRLYRILGQRAPVKSHHHQGFGRIGSGLVGAARADDGTVEALEDPSRRFVVGVLWHPEEGEDLALFEGLVEEARHHRAEHRR